MPVDNVDPYPTELSAERGWQVVSIGSRISEGVILAPTDLSMSHYLQRLMAHGVNRGLLPTYSPTEVYMAELGDKTIIIMPWRVLNTRGRYYPVSPRGREAERVNMSSSPNLIYSHDGNNIHRYLDIVGGIVAYNRDSNTPTFTARMVDGTARSREMVFEATLLARSTIGSMNDLVAMFGLNRPTRRAAIPVASLVGNVPNFIIRTKTLDFDERRPFGVEIETIGLGDAYTVQKLAKDKKHKVYSQEYSHRISDYWKVVPDGSLNSGGGELVSPPLRGLAGLDEMRAILSDLPEYKVGVDSSCGVHVHHSCPLDENSAPAVKRLLGAYGYFESKVIDYLVIPARRGDYNSYCLPINQMSGLSRTHPTIGDISRLAENISRYFKVNICPLNTYGTVEFRHHHGCIDPNDVANWVIFTQMVLQGATRNATETFDKYPRNCKGLMSWMFANHEPGKYALEALTALERRYVGNKGAAISTPGSIGRVFTRREEPRLPAMENLPNRVSFEYEDDDRETEDIWDDDEVVVCDDCGSIGVRHDQDCLAVISYIPCLSCGESETHWAGCPVREMRNASVSADRQAGRSIEQCYEYTDSIGRVYWMRAGRSLVAQLEEREASGFFVERDE